MAQWTLKRLLGVGALGGASLATTVLLSTQTPMFSDDTDSRHAHNAMSFDVSEAPAAPAAPERAN